MLIAGTAGMNGGVRPDKFSWDGATVYFVITDRFCNGDSANDVNYGRIVDYGSERLNAATFHGGDFKIRVPTVLPHKITLIDGIMATDSFGY